MQILPDFIFPLKMAKSRSQLVGVIPLIKMSNLCAYLINEKDEARIELEFGMERRLRYIKGTVEAELNLKCERCLEHYVEPMHIKLNLAMVMKESQLDAVPEDYEPIMVSEEMKLANIIEHELLLHLPMIAKHKQQDCSSYLNKLKKNTQQTQPPKPLAELAKLKGKL